MANRRGEKTRKSKPRTDGGDFQEMLREIQGKARRPSQAAALYYQGAHRFDLVGQRVEMVRRDLEPLGYDRNRIHGIAGEK